MTDWKEALIADCVVLQKQKELLECERAEDQDILNAEILLHKAMATIKELEQPYYEKITQVTDNIEGIHDKLIAEWDISDKTYECDTGTATVRTTKSLRISDKKQLIMTLLNIGKLPESIRTWNLSYLRKLKDVDMIDDQIASYDEHKNVVIKGAKDE